MARFADLRVVTKAWSIRVRVSAAGCGAAGERAGHRAIGNAPKTPSGPLAALPTLKLPFLCKGTRFCGDPCTGALLQ